MAKSGPVWLKYVYDAAAEFSTMVPVLGMDAGTGHFVMMERPEEFNRLLVAFLGKVKY